MGMVGLMWWIDRWRKSTAFTDMTLEQQGAYRNLLDEAWLRGGYIPQDERILARASGDVTTWKRVREVVLARFILTPQGYCNETLLDVMKKSKQRVEKQKRYRDRKKGGSGNDDGNGPGNETGNTHGHDAGNDHGNEAGYWIRIRIESFLQSKKALDARAGARSLASGCGSAKSSIESCSMSWAAQLRTWTFRPYTAAGTRSSSHRANNSTRWCSSSVEPLMPFAPCRRLGRHVAAATRSNGVRAKRRPIVVGRLRSSR
jgi:uncharacterized protein YdaU (DUF1376 family)